jgi:tetrathionate reductase subunit B
MPKYLPVLKNRFLPTRRDVLRGSAAAGVVAGVSSLTQPAAAYCGSELIPLVYPDQDKSEVRWGFLIDLRRCNGCNACSVSCKTENDVRLGYFRNGVIEDEAGTYPNTVRNFIPWLCNHCAVPPCLEVCPVDPIKASLTFPSGSTAEYWARATYQRPDGLVLIDQDRCVGCGECVTACPYQARYLDPVKAAGADPQSVGLDIAEPKAADKCTMCVHRLEQGVVPACVNTCPAGARVIGNLNDPSSEINQQIEAAGNQVSTLLEGAGTEPRVYYIGLEESAYARGNEPRREAGLQTVVPFL